MHTLRHPMARSIFSFISFHLLIFTGSPQTQHLGVSAIMKGGTLFIIHVEIGKDPAQCAFTINEMHSAMLRRGKNHLILIVSESFYGCLSFNILPFHNLYALVLFYFFISYLLCSQSFHIFLKNHLL